MSVCFYLVCIAVFLLNVCDSRKREFFFRQTGRLMYPVLLLCHAVFICILYPAFYATRMFCGAVFIYFLPVFFGDPSLLNVTWAAVTFLVNAVRNRAAGSRQ